MALQTCSTLWLHIGYFIFLQILYTVFTNSQKFYMTSLCPVRWTGLVARGNSLRLLLTQEGALSGGVPKTPRAQNGAQHTVGT